jgi:hypothetical protein
VHASISGTLLPSASCSTQLSFGAPATETIPFSLCSFRPDPKRVPRKIRYAWPVACQGATGANRLPPKPSDPLLSPYRLSTPSLPPAVSSGLSTLSAPGRARSSKPDKAEQGQPHTQNLSRALMPMRRLSLPQKLVERFHVFRRLATSPSLPEQRLGSPRRRPSPRPIQPNLE